MNQKEAITKYKRVALDTALFIYFVQAHPKFGKAVKEIFEKVKEGEVSALTTAITIAEIFSKVQSKALELSYRSLLFNFPNLWVCDITTHIAYEAGRLRKKYSITTPDALQIASALNYQCDAFITNDRALEKVSEIPVVLLGEL
ncbi:MAG: type II toxin-antitoxin system VapC family toxin [bacterium]